MKCATDRGNIRGKWQAAITAIVLTVALVASAGMTNTASADTVGTAVVDSDTRYAYQQSDVLGDAESTRYAGRVWVDKTVTSGDETLVFKDPSNDSSNESTAGIDVSNDGSDFLVTYSALAASQSVTSAAPTDTVFILDLSASMTWSYDGKQEAPTMESSRLYAMVNSMNQIIDTLAHANPQNRIAIVAFNGVVEPNLLDLTTGKEILNAVTDGNYLTVEEWDSGSASNNDDTTANVHCHINDNTASTDGGTNIQAGLFAGMSILAKVADVTVDVDGQSVTRVPNVVLMSDGAPTTFSSSGNASYMKYSITSSGTDQNKCIGEYNTGVITQKTEVCRASNAPVYSGSWWEYNNGGAQIGAGDNTNPDSADGFMALLTASYFKNKITRNYYGSLDGDQANVYTVGFASAQGQNAEMTMMSNIVLNPEEYLNAAKSFNDGQSSSNNNQIRQVYDAAEQYLNNQDAQLQGSIGDGGSDDQIRFVVRGNQDHPDDGNDPTSLYYPTQAFTAEDGDQLDDVLGQIADLITESAKSPTETTGNPADSGWITYEDPIGEYMHVDGVKTLIWAGTQFSNPSRTPDEGTDDNGNVTYTFSGTIDSPVYGTQNVDVIEITVHTDQSSGTQTLTVRIPSAAIPVRVTSVTLDGKGDPSSITNNGALPLRLVYGVSLNDTVMTAEGVLDTGSLAGYLTNPATGAAHIEGDTAYFYTNQYSGRSFDSKTSGDATVTFQPADNNPYYFIQEDTPLYIDAACQQRATAIDLNATYYYPFTYYEQDKNGAYVIQHGVMSRAGSTLAGYSTTDDTGGLLLTAGAPRLGGLADSIAEKPTDGNPTGTASTVRYPTFSGDIADGSFVVYLGNNGRLGVPITVTPATGEIALTKTVQGINSTTLDFDFDLVFTVQQVAGVTGQITDPDQIRVANAAGEWTRLPSSNTTTTTIDGPFSEDTPRTGTIRLRFSQAGTYVFTLSERDDSQPGWTYDDTEYQIAVTVAESANDPYTLTVTQILYGDDTAATSASFTNTFASISALPSTGGETTSNGLAFAGIVLLIPAIALWLLSRRRRI